MSLNGYNAYKYCSDRSNTRVGHWLSNTIITSVSDSVYTISNYSNTVTIYYRYNPTFSQIKYTSISITQYTNVTIPITAVLNDSLFLFGTAYYAFINNKWYSDGDSSLRVTSVSSSGITIYNGLATGTLYYAYY